jgi:AraC-like DNA-binding protein
MRVLAAVSDIMSRRLKQAAGRRFEFMRAASWDEAVGLILHEPVELGVLDPALEGSEPRTQEIERIRVLFPSLPIVLYTRLTPDMASLLLRFGGIGIRQALLAGHDDHPQRLSDVLTAAGNHVLSAQLVDAMSDLLARCPGELRWAIQTMIREPDGVQSVQQLAERARMDRRTCLRWFARAKLPPPRVMLTVLRVMYAHRLLQDPGYTVEDVATKLGYAQVRSFAQNVKDVFGRTPSEIRVGLSPEEALALVRERYFPRKKRSLARVG